MRTNTAWVTARVCGRRRVKAVPSPSFERMSSEPPSWRTSLATTSMPTPQPQPADRLRGRAGLHDQRVEVGFGQDRVVADQAAFDRAAADRVAVEAGAVVGDEYRARLPNLGGTWR